MVLRLCLFILLAPGLALAQVRPSMDVEFGWGSLIAPDCWNPVRVHVDAGDQILSGRVELRYTQTRTQGVAAIAKLVTTPGRGGTTSLALPFPDQLGEIDATFTIDGQFRPRISTSYEAVPLRGLPLGRVLPQGSSIVVTVGSIPLEPVFRLWHDRAPEPPSNPATGEAPKPTPDEVLAHALARFHSASAAPASLPTDWLAYESVGILIVAASEANAIDEHAREAIASWVAWGGRLLIIADSPSPTWRSLAPEVSFTLADAAEVAPGEGLRAILEPTGEVPAASITARTGSSAADSGWVEDWQTDAGPLLAYGPSGFGIVGVIGIDPRRIPATVSPEATAALWAYAFQRIAPDLIDARGRAIALAARSGFGGPFSASGATGETASLVATYNTSSLSAGVGFGTFILIALATLALAILIGPVDLVALRARGRGGLWWATCLGWTALAGSIAFAAPRLLRSGETRMERSACDDYTSGHGGWTSGASVIFSGDTRSLRLTGASDDSWWKVGDAEGWSYMPPRRTSLSFLPFVAARGVVPARLGGRIWSIQTLADQGSLPPGPMARIVRADGEITIEIAGLGGGISCLSGTIRTSSSTLPIGFASNEGGRIVAHVHGGPLDDRWRPPSDDDPARWNPWGPQVQGGNLHTLTRLAGAWRREHAIALRLATGRWALISLEVGGAAGPGLDLAPTDQRRVVRILAPIEGDRAEALP